MLNMNITQNIIIQPLLERKIGNSKVMPIILQGNSKMMKS